LKPEEYFGSEVEILNNVPWNWKTFKSTKGFPVSKYLLDWVIGQDKALEECYLCLDEWSYKLDWMKKEQWYKSWSDPNSIKPTAKKFIPPGPYLMLLGDPGTGKSLIGRALAGHLTRLYEKRAITLKDVICWPNKLIPSEPKISVVDAGKGSAIIRKEKLKQGKKRRLKNILIKFVTGFMTTVATIFVSIGMFWLWQSYNLWHAFNGYVGPFGTYIPLLDYMLQRFISIGSTTFLPAGMMLIFLILIIFMGRFGMMGGTKGIGGSEQTEAPKLLVNNSQEVAPFVDATGHKSAQLFGSIAWDPLQTGGLGTPEHQRTSAGDVHKANLGILYIDEIKNLHAEEAVTLLTVLEEGQLPITLRSRWSASGTSAMAVSTEPVPCLTFLVGAGNFDSIPNIHPALMDRIYGYGKVVRMENDAPNTVGLRRKYIQFISQEVKRFHLLPFSREACMEIIDEGRRRSNKRDALTTKFRPLISIIKTAGTIAKNEKCKFVLPKHVKEAITEHCKTIGKQLIEHYIKERGKYAEIDPKGTKPGTIYGLAIVADHYSGEHTGTVLKVKGQLLKGAQSYLSKPEGYYMVTGIPEKPLWIHASIAKVRSVILKLFNTDIAKSYYTHLDFSQSYRVDGPSAGVTMAILLCALLQGKSIRQDVAVTGDLNISSTDEVAITAVGGLHEKILAAQMWGFSKVCIPMKNYKHSIDPADYTIKIVGCRTLSDYLKEVLVE